MTKYEEFCLWLTGYLEDADEGLSTAGTNRVKQRLAETLKRPQAAKATQKKAPARTTAKGRSVVR